MFRYYTLFTPKVWSSSRLCGVGLFDDESPTARCLLLLGMKNETKGLATKTPHPGERKRKKERKKERKKRREGGGGGGVFSSFPNAFF